jgi:hypothetical protein
MLSIRAFKSSSEGFPEAERATKGTALNADRAAIRDARATLDRAVRNTVGDASTWPFDGLARNASSAP